MKVAGLRKQSMDVAIIDAVWNGVWQAMKIAGAADAFEVNIAPHNFYGHLVVPDAPGWGTEPIEEAIKSHLPRAPGGLLHYRQS